MTGPETPWAGSEPSWDDPEPAHDEVWEDNASAAYGQPAGESEVGAAQTGAAEASVGAALAGLEAVRDRPPADQVDAFTAAHEALQATLARIDEH